LNAKSATLDGIEFILFYIVTFLFLRFGVFLLRAFWWETTAVSVFGFLVFEALGANRFIYGYFFGEMKDFTFLFFAMAIGGALFFTHYESSGRLRGKKRRNNSSGCSGCGSCASDSSCGGGCGGCG
jgi:hypothetical protein